MAKPRRRGKPVPRKKRKRRLGTVLFFVGLLAVLGGTFAAGALAGRFSLKPSASVAAPRVSDRAPKPAPPPQPELTFYRELTAPLTPPLPPPRPATKPTPKREVVTVPPAADPPPPPAAENVVATLPAHAEAGRYTVQVGSYNVRAQADALRSRLASSGHEAYIAEGEAGGVTRYRVRIGMFTSAEEARQAAVRLASQAHVATYVTTR